MTDLHFLSPESDAQFIEKIRAALRQIGGLLPLTDREVKLAEESMAFERDVSSSDLPDPYQLFEEGMDACPAAKPDRHPATSERRGFQNEVEQSLAMAAREGKEVPEEIRVKMLEDRKRAEREHEDEGDASEEQ